MLEYNHDAKTTIEAIGLNKTLVQKMTEKILEFFTGGPNEYVQVSEQIEAFEVMVESNPALKRFCYHFIVFHFLEKMEELGLVFFHPQDDMLNKVEKH